MKKLVCRLLRCAELILPSGKSGREIKAFLLAKVRRDTAARDTRKNNNTTCQHNIGVVANDTRDAELETWLFF
jgi:hypothetical protein